MEYKRGNSWKAKLKYNVDRTIWSFVSFDEFLMKMKEAGYEIRQGKYLAFRAPYQKHFTNVKTLGAYYAEDGIPRRNNPSDPVWKGGVCKSATSMLIPHFFFFANLSIYLIECFYIAYKRRMIIIISG